MAFSGKIRKAMTDTGKKENIFSPADDRADSANAAYAGEVRAGFPSPAESIPERKLDLNSYLIKHPSSTFFLKVEGNSMINDGFDDGDLIIVDKSIEPYEGCVAVCFIDGEFTLKRVEKKGNSFLLKPANPKFKPIAVTEENRFDIWGIVTYAIKKIR